MTTLMVRCPHGSRTFHGDRHRGDRPLAQGRHSDALPFMRGGAFLDQPGSLVHRVSQRTSPASIISLFSGTSGNAQSAHDGRSHGGFFYPFFDPFIDQYDS